MAYEHSTQPLAADMTTLIHDPLRDEVALQLTGTTESALLLAALVMVSLAVLGWAAIWVDNEITGHWLEWAGGTVMVVALGTALAARRHPSDHLG